MNHPDIKKNMDQVMIETLGELAFIDLIPLSPQSDIKSFSHVLTLDFQRPESGGFILYLSKETKQKFIENIYSENWLDLTPNQIDDGLLEILNIIAGKFLSLHFEGISKYQMNLPQLLFEIPEYLNEKTLNDFFYDAEGEILKIAFWKD